MSENVQELSRDEMKVMALRERVATLTAEYEDKIAELRIDLTILSNENEELKKSAGDSDAKASKGKG